MKRGEKILVYTDGACSGNPGPGGWGCLLICGDYTKELSGHVDNTTNNRMEITAVIEGLKALKTKALPVEVITDSRYVVGTMTENWKRKMNSDLWKQLDEVKEGLTITWTWVRGHADNEHNNRADTLAVMARDAK